MENIPLIKHPFHAWRYMCEKSGLTYPWYTESCLQWLKTIDVSKWKIFEYGAGISTFWWKFNAKEVHSVDSNHDWAANVGAMYTQEPERYVSAIDAVGNNNSFDIIIIDGTWRDDCTAWAVAKIKEGGYIIADNYHQESACPLSEWVKTDELMKDFPVVIFHQQGHPDWKTAVWQIVKK